RVAHRGLLDVGRHDPHLAELARRAREGEQPRAEDPVVVAHEDAHRSPSSLVGPSPCPHSEIVGSSRKPWRVLVVHNPSSGLRQPETRALLEAMRGAGYEVLYRALDEGLEDALAVESEIVVAAGGDGTVSKVARHLL